MTKAKVGRPSKYTPELLEKAKNYLHIYEDLGSAIPSVIGMSLYLDINRDTLYAWGKDEDKKEFSDILRKINSTQHEVLISKGLSGKFNSNIVKLVLGKHGYSEKNQTEVSGPDGKPQEHSWKIEFVEAKDNDK